MGNCLFRINIDGHYQEFSSQEELNSFLRANKKSLTTSLLTDKIVFSKDRSAQDLANDKIRAMSENVVFDKKNHILTVDSKSYTPVTKYISSEKLIPEFKMAEWENNTRDRLLKDINIDGSQKYTVAEAQVIVKQLKDSWEVQSMVGTSFHDIAEAFFNGTIENPEDIIKLVPELKDREYILKKYVSTLNTLKAQLQGRHGDDAIFQTEVKLYDEQKKVAGVADLLVIDNKGKIHIYDYKTSVKDEGQWSQAKQLTIDYQLAMYRQILRRNNLDVDTVNYLPVELNDVDYETKVINEFNLKPMKTLYLTEGDRVMQNISRLLPYDFSTKLADVTSNKEVYDFLKEAFNYESPRDKEPEPLLVDEEFEKLKARTGPSQKNYILYNPINWKANRAIPKSTPDAKVKEILAAHLKYLNEYQKYLPIKVYDFVTYAKGQNEKGEIIDWETHWAKDPSTVNKMTFLLSKYISDPAWKPLQSDTLYDLNTVAFENAETKQIDFLTLSNSNLEKSPELLRGKTLLGNFLVDNKALQQGIPSKVTNGDIELYKLMAFIKSNKDIFEDKVIGSMYALNIYKNNIVPRVYTQTIGALSDQWDKLIKNIPSSITIKNRDWAVPSIDYTDAFVQDISNLFEKNTFRPLNYALIKRALDNLTVATEKEEKIENLALISEKLQAMINFDPHTGVFRQPDASRLVYIASQALLQLKDLPTIREADMKLNGFILGESVNFSNPTSVANQAYQNVVRLTGEAMSNTTHVFNGYKERIRTMTSDFYKAQGNFTKVKLIGYNLDVFNNLFEVVDGKRTMKFKDPDNAQDLKPAEIKFIREYTSILNEIRAIKMKLDGDSGQVPAEIKLNIPLMRSSDMTAFVGSNYREWFKNYFRDITNPNNIYKNDTDSAELLKDQSRMFNMFDRYDMNPESRQEKIDASETSEFETDLEAVLDMYTMMHAKESEMNKILPIINAQKMFTMFSEHYMFENNKNTAKGLNDYIGTVIFDKNLIAEESKNLAVTAQVAKTMVSYASIGFSAVGGLTEFLTGWSNNITKTLANYFDPTAFTAGNLGQAAALIFGDLATNKLSYENVSLGDNLNEMFRISDMNLKELVHKVQTTSSGLSKFSSHWAYWMQSFPTYTNRMTMFVAQMVKDGIIHVDALGKPSKGSAIQMINGKMVYNEKLDLRFGEYLSNPDKPEHLQTDSYKESRATYLKMKELLAQEPNGLKADGTLARPYDNRTRDSIKQAADDVHGNYDKETKTRVEQLAFGKVFLQFKTYLSSKRNRWYMETKPSDRKGKWVTEWQDGVPVKMWQGTVTEGIWQTLMALGNETISNKGNIIKSWDSMHDTQKHNIGLMFGDILQFAIYSLMLSLVGYAALKKTDPLQGELLRGFSNSTQDLWIGNALTAFGGAKNPIAVLSWSTNVMTDMWSAVSGKENGGTDLLNNIAIFRSINKMTN